MVAVVSIGLFAGLMFALVFPLHRHWSAQRPAEYADLRGFLLAAKGHPVITVLTFGSFLLPGVLALVEPDGTAKLLYALAGGVFLLGCFGVTLLLNFPIYQEVIGWSTEPTASDWDRVRMRFLVVNVIRFAAALSALILVAVAGLV
ncbi:MAG: DUF1772 domain-containing protein [Propionicimonas sp.]